MLQHVCFRVLLPNHTVFREKLPVVTVFKRGHPNQVSLDQKRLIHGVPTRGNFDWGTPREHNTDA